MSSPTARTGPGRPKVGGLVRDARLGDGLLARVEQMAAEAGVPRSEMLRTLVGEAVAQRDAPTAPAPRSEALARGWIKG